MKHCSTNQQTLLKALVITASIIPPCLLCLFLYGKWNPFLLNGPQFLSFYGLYMATALLLVLFLKIIRHLKINSGPQPAWHRSLLTSGLLLAAMRVAQGIYHNRPVSYLVMMTLLYVLLMMVFRLKTRSN